MKINSNTQTDKATTFKVGDIVCYVYQYSARIVTFAIVTRVTAKSIWIKDIKKKWTSHDGYGQNGQVIPDLDAPVISQEKGPFRIKKSWDGSEGFKVSNWSWGHVWNGMPEDEYTD